MVVVGIPYAWWASGLTPFTTRAYVAVAIPVAVVVVASFLHFPGRNLPTGFGAERRITVAGAWPWLALGVAAVALEIAGLALGGRSPAVPTLSTVVDHALRRHAVRFLLFGAWLAIGAVPVLRVRRTPVRPVT